MFQSFETTGPPPPGHSGEFNTAQVLKNINSPAPVANCSVKTPVQPGFSIPIHAFELPVFRNFRLNFHQVFKVGV
jgi:hypothetical protein